MTRLLRSALMFLWVLAGTLLVLLLMAGCYFMALILWAWGSNA